MELIVHNKAGMFPANLLAPTLRYSSDELAPGETCRTPPILLIDRSRCFS
jgi:hypothetical protein